MKSGKTRIFLVVLVFDPCSVCGRHVSIHHRISLTLHLVVGNKSRILESPDDDDLEFLHVDSEKDPTEGDDWPGHTLCNHIHVY
jgi:hypothetical protein